MLNSKQLQRRSEGGRIVVYEGLLEDKNIFHYFSSSSKINSHCNGNPS